MKVFESLWKSLKVSESLLKVYESLLMNLTVMHSKRVLSLVCVIFQFCPIFNFCLIFNPVQFSIYNFVQFSQFSISNFVQFAKFSVLTILYRALDRNFQSCFFIDLTCLAWLWTTLKVSLIMVPLVPDTQIWPYRLFWCCWRNNRPRAKDSWSFAPPAEKTFWTKWKCCRHSRMCFMSLTWARLNTLNESLKLIRDFLHKNGRPSEVIF